MAPSKEQDFDFESRLPCDERYYTPFPVDAFDDLKLLVHLKAELNQVSDEEAERMSFVYQNFTSRCLARASVALSTPTSSSSKELNASRCIKLGQILFLYTICPSMSVSGVYCQSIATALRACLESGCGESEESVRWSPEVLCWLLINGAITRQTRALQHWYLRRIVDFMRRRGVRTFLQLEVTLRKVVWTEDRFGAACRSIWPELCYLGGTEQ